MASLAIAAVGTAAAAYAYRQALLLDPDRPTVQSHTNQHEAPNNWVEALYFITETMRYAYSETLGRWKTADLLLGLMYLSRREGDVYPASDIVSQGVAVDAGDDRQQVAAVLDELTVFKRVLSLCCVQRLKHDLQEAAWKELGIGETDVLKRFPRAGVLRPAFSVLRDRKLRAIVLVVRGTHSLKDMFTCLTSAVKPHHMTSPDGVVLGYSHFGMLAAARWILKESRTTLEKAMEENPGLQLLVAGHSLGGGTAAMLTMMLREQHPRFAEARCYTLATPSCMTKELSKSCAPYVTTVVHGADVVPTFSPATMDRLREEVAASHWYDDLRQSSLILRTVEGGLRGVGCATRWTARSLVWGVTMPVLAVRKTGACVTRKKAVPRSPRPSNNPHSDQDTFRLASMGKFRGPGANSSCSDPFSNSVPPEVDSDHQSPALHRRHRGQPAARPWAFVNPSTWFSDCRGMYGGPQQQQQQQHLQHLLQQQQQQPQQPLLSSPHHTFGALPGRRSNGWMRRRSTEDSDTDAMNVLADFDMESVQSLAFDDEVAQQFQDEITECVEELQNNPDNSLQEGLTDLMQEVAQAEKEEALEQGEPMPPDTPPFTMDASMSRRSRDDDYRSSPGGAGIGTENGSGAPGPGEASGPGPGNMPLGWEAQRHMYPPGRIFHLAPRRALQASSPAEQLGEYAAQQLSHCAGGLELELWGTGMALTPSRVSSEAAAEHQPQQRSNSGSGGSHALSSPRMRTISHNGSEAAPSQAPGLMAPASRTPLDSPEKLGSEFTAARGGLGDEAGPNEAEDEYLWFKDIPQEAYGRMKVCPQMIRDHTLPAYLRAIDSVQGQLAASLEGTGRPQDYVERLPDFCFRVPRD